MLLSQHGACRPAAGNWDCTLPFFPFSISSPRLFPPVFSCLSFSALFICCILFPLNYSQHCFPFFSSSPNKRTAAGYWRSRGSSAMCSWSKLHIESPSGRFSCNIMTQSVAFSLRWNRVMVRLRNMDLLLTHYPVLLWHVEISNCSTVL